MTKPALLPCPLRPYDQLTAAQPGSATPLHIQQPLYDNGQLTVRMLILGVSVGSEETLYRVLWRRRVCIDSPGNGKLFQMTVVAERALLLPADSAAVHCRYFVSASSPCDFADFKAAPSKHHRLLSTPSCDEVKLASGSPPPEQCPAALETQPAGCSWSPPGRHPGVAPTRPERGSGNDLLSYLVTLDSGASAGTTALRIVRRRIGVVEDRGTSIISGYAASSGGPLGGRPGRRRLRPRSAPAGKRQVFRRRRWRGWSNVNGGLYPQMDPDRAVTRVLP
uniref:Uncharacterized protein n=1 Tax=Macrostomum lignano TaxID=282301 RepID=A0A1I8FAD8_9PLAT